MFIRNKVSRRKIKKESERVLREEKGRKGKGKERKKNKNKKEKKEKKERTWKEKEKEKEENKKEKERRGYRRTGNDKGQVRKRTMIKTTESDGVRRGKGR